ncbi:putative nuclease HARBI1 [Chionoecetes opilio]|uniref:Putative nuclease HARBI1 n=1 Tax=Chionoecetes opilio TaxID=41210 RepID=A0A8J4YJM1_CHIOP|nr:putative nuclease HARBI1 [Chionoecetes opilio]
MVKECGMKLLELIQKAPVTCSGNITLFPTSTFFPCATICSSLLQAWRRQALQCGLRISPSLQLLVALRYLATGNFQLTLADTADMSQPSVSRCLKTVVHAIAEVAPRYIRFPTPAEEAGVMQAFSTIAGMPGCIGCLDGTLIPVRGPGGEETELYSGRKGFYA